MSATTAPETSHPTAAACQFLTFAVAGEEYGVDIMRVREIRGWAETTRLPEAPEHVRGVINLRGAIIPIFDLRLRFGMTRTETTARHVVIILAVGSRSVGLLVDAVSDILDVTESDIKPAPHTEADAGRDYVAGLIAIEERMVVLIEPERLLLGETALPPPPMADAA